MMNDADEIVQKVSRVLHIGNAQQGPPAPVAALTGGEPVAEAGASARVRAATPSSPRWFVVRALQHLGAKLESRTRRAI